jgi:hypothetical protein
MLTKFEGNPDIIEAIIKKGLFHSGHVTKLNF